MDFNSLASVNIEALPTVKLLPRGTYIFSVDRIPDNNKSKSGKGTNILFRLKIVRPIDNFEDPIALEEFGNPVGETRSVNFYIPEIPNEDDDPDQFVRRQARNLGDLMDFLVVKLGVKDGGTLMEKIQMSVHHQCLGTVKHVPDRNNPMRMVDQLDSADIAPIGE